MSSMFTGTLGLIFVIFLAVTAILWFCLPFAVFGVKKRLDQAIEQAVIANRRLEAIERRLPQPETNSRTPTLHVEVTGSHE